MICKFCKNEIPDGSIFCNWCGERQIRTREKKKDIRVPAPRQLPSGRWYIQLRAERQSITEDTEELCLSKARAIRAGWLAKQKTKTGITLREAIDQYIDRRSNVLSPSTIRGYTKIRDHRFAGVMDAELVDGMDWQKICNIEAKIVHAKTLKNAWGLIAAVLKDQNIPVPTVRLPQVIRSEKKWLTPEQIKIFIPALQGQDVAIPAMMALCSLRRSEILAVTWDDIDPKCEQIRVSGAMVVNKDGQFTVKKENKNTTSARIVPILMPELSDLLRRSRSAGPVVTMHPNTIHDKINRICRQFELPEVGTHGLRHSFASLAHHLGVPEREAMRIGGWADRDTMHRIYIHLSEADKIKESTRLKAFFTDEFTDEI